jgi:hypothetical protein
MAVSVAEQLGLSDEEREFQDVYPTGKRRPFYSRLRDVAHLLVKAGLLTLVASNKYKVTDRGHAALAAAEPAASEAAEPPASDAAQ